VLSAWHRSTVMHLDALRLINNIPSRDGRAECGRSFYSRNHGNGGIRLATIHFRSSRSTKDDCRLYFCLRYRLCYLLNQWHFQWYLLYFHYYILFYLNYCFRNLRLIQRLDMYRDLCLICDYSQKWDKVIDGRASSIDEFPLQILFSSFHLWIVYFWNSFGQRLGIVIIKS
jgi:hypothetical protein